MYWNQVLACSGRLPGMVVAILSLIAGGALDLVMLHGRHIPAPDWRKHPGTCKRTKVKRLDVLEATELPNGPTMTIVLHRQLPRNTRGGHQAAAPPNERSPERAHENMAANAIFEMRRVIDSRLRS